MNTSATFTSRREQLIEVARRGVEESGPEALRARGLTAEIGTSTQAIYTLFGGMPGLLAAIVADGFAEFAQFVGTVPESDDAVADFFAKGWAYSEWALSHSQLYRLMYGLTGGELRQHPGVEVAAAGTVANSPEAQRAVDVLINSMRRVVESGRIDPIDPVIAAGQFLSATHGYILLEIAGVYGREGAGLDVARRFAINLMVGLGDDRAAAAKSLQVVEASRVAAS